ncbi:hypothetical protein B0A55_03859 [Friedmanniomyces simplex]|uniref:Uncharacterized protein n=1 Tax=Friedmanniomyces simplex TaxID=329884 RepID=A0A4V6WL47_9PEZI|nr:hypothetical protein B0A55_03859 [Friedmanniomyces simplex]
MPCDNVSHTHTWPDSGALTIERCEVFCQYCTNEGDRKHRHKFAWFLRRHVEGVHIKNGRGSHAHVTLSKGWTGMPEGSKGLKGNSARGPRRVRNKKALSLSRSPSPPAASYTVEAQVSQADLAVAGQIERFVPSQVSGGERVAKKMAGAVDSGEQQLHVYDPAPHSSESEMPSDNNNAIHDAVYKQLGLGLYDPAAHSSEDDELPKFNNTFDPNIHFAGMYDNLKNIFSAQPYQAVDTCDLAALQTNNTMPSLDTGLAGFANLDATAGFDTTNFDNAGLDTPDYTTNLPDLTDLTTIPGFATPPPLVHDYNNNNSSSSEESSSSLDNASPLSTPQRRIGPPIVMEMPLTPTSLLHREWLREKLNEITEALAAQKAKDSVVAWGLHEYGRHFTSGGALTIERCEVFCQYCTDASDRKHRHKFAWFLRRHVEGVHIKNGRGSHARVTLSKGWTGMPEGSKGLKGNSERGPRRVRNKKALSLSLSPSPPPPASYTVEVQVSQADLAVGGQIERFVASQVSGGERVPKKMAGAVDSDEQQLHVYDPAAHSSESEMPSDNNNAIHDAVYKQLGLGLYDPAAHSSGDDEVPKFNNTFDPNVHFTGVYDNLKNIFSAQPYQANVSGFANFDATAGLDTLGYGLDTTNFDTAGLDTTNFDTTNFDNAGLDTTDYTTNLPDLTNPTDLTTIPGFATPPALVHDYNNNNSSSSEESSSSLDNASPLSTPQRRIGPPIVMEMPLTPTSLLHREWLREKLNEITEALAAQKAKDSVVAWGLQEYGRHFTSGCAY